METNKKQVSEIMTRTVCEVTTDFSAEQVLALMTGKGVSSVLVVEDRLTLGIVTERDVVRNLHRSGSLKGLSCADLMQTPVICIEATANCLDVYHLMGGRRIRHVAVTDAEGLLVGIVSESDILRDFGVEHYMRFKDVGGAMSKDFCLLPESATVAEVVARMDEGRYSCVFAVDGDGRPAGILTERDVVRLCQQHDNPDRLLFGATMSKPVKTANIDDLLRDAVISMQHSSIRRLAVVAPDGSMCGVLTHHDVVNDLEGQYVSFLKEMVERQEMALQTGQEVANEKTALENIMRSAIGTAVITTDLECRIDYGNLAVTAIAKLKPFAATGEDIREILSRLGWPGCRDVLMPEKMSGGQTHTQELAWIAADGPHRAELQISLLIDEKNQSRGYLLLVR